MLFEIDHHCMVFLINSKKIKQVHLYDLYISFYIPPDVDFSFAFKLLTNGINI